MCFGCLAQCFLTVKLNASGQRAWIWGLNFISRGISFSFHSLVSTSSVLKNCQICSVHEQCNCTFQLPWLRQKNGRFYRRRNFILPADIKSGYAHFWNREILWVLLSIPPVNIITGIFVRLSGAFSRGKTYKIMVVCFLWLLRLYHPPADAFLSPK